MKEFGFAITLFSVLMSYAVFIRAYDASEWVAFLWLALVLVNCWSLGVSIRRLIKED